MAEFLENKCKNCGADLDLNAAKGRVLTCDYCHSKFTLPKEQISPTALALLRSGEQNLDTRHFDDAYIMYQKAAEEDPNEPEAYFGMALAKAQVQYLKDYRANRKEVSTDFRLQPICYEISEKKFTEDQNFLKAIKLATPEQISTYREKGEEIDRIRAEFCELKKSGLSYDCFICVKVTLEDGKGHTEDSHLALQLYHNLKDAGYHPFYSEEEMKDRSGAKYEALILYALYTSDCMLVVCTNDDYLQTPWVRNEYSRYMKMLVEAEKQRESITIAFKSTPIEKLPGLSGKIQGIDLGNYDGLSRVLKFVDRFASSKNVIPLLKRKDYSGQTVTKKTSMKQEIEKRKIEVIQGGSVTVSDQIKLKNAEDFMQRGDFPRAIRFCMEVIRDNPTTGKAYWLLFLAENGCKDKDGMIQLHTPVLNYENFEKAIAATESQKERTDYYIILSERIKQQRDLNTYSEFIALPEATEDWIASLTEYMYGAAWAEKNTQIFDTIIKTVSNTDKYIEMNLGFAHVTNRRKAMECYRNVLNADEGNHEALYECFIEDHDLTYDRELFIYSSNENNHAELESGLFAYGFNAYAMEKLMAIAHQNVRRQPKEACSLFDFLLTMIPEENNKMYLDALNRFIEVLFKDEQYDYIEKYNNMLLSINEFDDNAYFNRVLLSRKINNPLALMKEANKLLDDENYMSAYNAYAAKHNGVNLYMQINDALNELASLLRYPECIDFIVKNIHRTKKNELLTGKSEIRDRIKQQAQGYWREFLGKYHVSSEEGLYQLRQSVTSDPTLKLAQKFATVGGDETLLKLTQEVYRKQEKSAAENCARDKAAAAAQRKADNRTKAFCCLVAVAIIGSLVGIATLSLSYLGIIDFWSIWALSALGSEGFRALPMVFFVLLAVAMILAFLLDLRHAIGWRTRGWRIAVSIVSIIVSCCFFVSGIVCNINVTTDRGNLYVNDEYYLLLREYKEGWAIKKFVARNDGIKEINIIDEYAERNILYIDNEVFHASSWGLYGVFSNSSLDETTAGVLMQVTTIKLPKDLNEIGESAFEGCRNLTTVVMGDKLQSIRTSAFQDTKLSSIVYSGTTEEWNAISKGRYWDMYSNAGLLYTLNYSVYCKDGTIK